MRAKKSHNLYFTKSFFYTISTIRKLFDGVDWKQGHQMKMHWAHMRGIVSSDEILDW